jgi:hypothetical protein
MPQISVGAIQEEREPGVQTQMRISMATDPEQRLRIAGAQFFPDFAKLITTFMYSMIRAGAWRR